MKVLVVVVTYNAMKWARKCFDSVVHSTIKLDLFIVDNGSTDETRSWIKQNVEYVQFIESDDNLGFGRANNLGLKYALERDYDYVYLLNQDAWVYPDTIKRLVDVHASYPMYGILSPLQIQANEKNLDSNFLANTIVLGCNNILLNDLLFLGELKEVYSTRNIMAAHWLLSRKCIQTVGGFSPAFPHYGEDNNYEQRVLYHGFLSGIVPCTKAVHDREMRITSNEKYMYLCYTTVLEKMSNPETKTIRPLVWYVLSSPYMSLKNGSFDPMYYAWKLLTSYHRIKYLREYSLNCQPCFL